MKRCLALMLVLGLMSCGGDEQESGERPAECPEIVYVGEGAEPSSFHSGGQLCEGSDAIPGSNASCPGIDVIYPLMKLARNLCLSMPGLRWTTIFIASKIQFHCRITTLRNV